MNQNRLLPYIISFLLLIAVLIVNQHTVNQTQRYSTEVNQARELIISFERLSSHLKSAEIFSKAYASAYKKFYLLLEQETNGIDQEIISLQQKVRSNPKQWTRVLIVKRMVQEQMKTLRQKNIAEIIASGEIWRLDSLNKIHALLKAAGQTEEDLLEQKELQLKTSTQNNQILTIIFSIIAFALPLASLTYNWWLTRKGKWLEGFLETILNTTHNGILHFKTTTLSKKILDFEVDFANKAIEKHLGYKVTEVLGKKLLEIGLLRKNTEEYQHFFNVATTGRPAEFEMQFTNNGQQKWFYIMLAKMENGVTATLQDMTEIRQNQDKLSHNIQQLENSNTELEQYAYVASHDLQEPLRKIMIYGGFLKQHQFEKLDDKGKIHVDKINQSAERLSTLIQDILNFSGIKRENEFVPTNINDIINQVLTDLELSIEQSRAVIDCGPLPVVDAIPLQINQLFFNLLANAIKFAKPGIPPSINIVSRVPDKKELAGIERLNKKLSYCEFLVSDNGIGFSQEYARQIFGMFKRLNSKKNYPGSGIGLALCEKVVTNHNGKIFATSVAGQGSTFHIILPINQ